MYSWAAARTALPVVSSIRTFGGPALSTSTLPTFRSDVLTARTFGAVVSCVVVVVCFFPPEQAPSTSASATAHATVVAGALVDARARGDLWRSTTGVIFSFARR